MHNQNNRVFLLPSDKNRIARLKKDLDPTRRYSWAYFGKDVVRAKRIEKLLGDDIPRIFIGDILQETARESRQEYIDYIGNLFSSTDSRIWFLTSLSEKNPFITSFHLSYCYIEAGRKILAADTEGDRIFICENESVLNILKENLKNDFQTEIHVIERDLRRLLSPVRCQFEKGIRRCWYCLRYMLRIMLAKLFGFLRRDCRNRDRGRRYIVLHTWTDRRSFQDNKSFNKIYFGDIGENLEKSWTSFVYLADILPTIWFPVAAYKLLFEKKNVWLMEEFLDILDPVRSLIDTGRLYPRLDRVPKFRGIDVTDIVSDEITEERQNTRVEQALLCDSISRQLCRALDVGVFLYSFEHHYWEKMFCKAIKQTCSDAAVVGYSIVFINPMYTCYSISEKEKSRAPLPDLLFVSGEQGRSMLVNSGFDPDNILVGGAIRYPDLSKKPESQTQIKGKSILVALSGGLNASFELIFKTIRAFSQCTDFSIIIKCHPTIPFSSLASSLPTLPDHFTISESRIQDLLTRAGVVLYTESSVCVEAVARGVPIIHIRSDHAIDINIFEDNPLVPSCTDPEDIYRNTYRVLNNHVDIPSEEVVHYLFQPTDSDLIISEILKLLNLDKRPQDPRRIGRQGTTADIS